ncbi:MAG: glycosyltransferase, partial [Patescibacteria group bacterium]|nr:glycosyltransferase [Patescibacteria group bacterium]
MTSQDSDKPLVSILIPTKDNVKLLKACIESIEAKSSYKNYEIIIVDNGSKKEETKKYLGILKHKILSYDKPFNFSSINNFAVANARGEHVIFLNDDTSVISQNWTE